MKTKMILLAASLVAGLAATAASAYRGGYILEIMYLDDNGRVVGEKIVNQCYGSTYSWGQKTSRTIVSSEPCGDNFDIR
ncbi:DUF6289 family protein (plasmid) [Pseudoalteromonas sp. T1lg65]|uniref:DUF6289 family protein n=1 Tax=Pseudoalteromonas sp. T1lg65 TaxID=2077101 RepID=UPI003F798761